MHLPEQLCSNLSRHAGVIAYNLCYGWLLWVPDDPGAGTGDPLPAEVLTIQRYARAHDCDDVLLDQDADVNEQLPAWDW